MRESGILLPVSSLPSPYGVGTLGAAAHEFVDFLADAGQTWWQLLPLGPTDGSGSPYKSPSAFAGNSMFIDLDLLIEAGLLERRELDEMFWGGDPTRLDRMAVEGGRRVLLHRAYERYQPDEAYRDFARRSDWLEGWALYAAICDHRHGEPWFLWPEDIRLRRPEAVARWSEELADEIGYHRFLQFLFYDQFGALRAYARKQGVRLFGDVPIYVALASTDVWLAPELFQIGEDHMPRFVSGCPGDYFNPEGQRWGDPIYDWDAMAKDGYAWWLRRLRGASQLYDAVRIDHFRALASYWAIPAKDETAVNGSWKPGPGRAFIDAVKDAFGDMEFIAEDLGHLTEEVHALREYAGWPGMKILQFAFAPDGTSIYLPHHYDKNCVCYTGTHDNETLRQWWDGLDPDARAFAVAYLGLNEREGWLDGVIRGGMASTADRFICPVQDWLGLGAEARINTPGVAEGCWLWRLRPGLLTPELSAKIRAVTARYGRL